MRVVAAVDLISPRRGAGADDPLSYSWRHIDSRRKAEVNAAGLSDNNYILSVEIFEMTKKSEDIRLFVHCLLDLYPSSSN